jgi:hypothetical protein
MLFKDANGRSKGGIMSGRNTLESLVATASEMRDSLSSMQKASGRLPMLAEREQIALVKRDMRIIDETQSGKILVAEELERHVLKLRQLSERLAAMYRDVTGEPVADADNVTDAVRIISRLRNALEDGSSATALSVVDHLVAGLTTQIRDFKEFQRTVWPRIEANQSIIAKQLRFHREHFVFWKKIEEEMAAPYGRKGAPSMPASISVLNVKA